jgi:hypothetical protein
MGGLSIASLVGFICAYHTNQPAAYFLMPNRFWEMGAGCLLFLITKHYPKYIYLFKKAPPVAVIGAMALTLFSPLEFAVPATIAIVILTAALITCLHQKNFAYSLFSNSRITYIGLISYSLYLWHWGVLVISRWTIGIHWWSIPFQLGLMLLLAIISYKYIETPLRHARWAGSRLRSIVYGLGASTSAAILLFAVLKMSPLLYTGQFPSMIQMGGVSLSKPYELKPVNSVWQGSKCILANNSEVGKKIPIEDCTLGNFSAAKKRIMVFGDSYSASLTQAFDDLVLSDRYAVTIISSLGSPPTKNIANEHAWGDKATDYYWNTIIPSSINELKPGDWVFLINRLDFLSPKRASSETLENLQKFKNALASLSEELSKKGIRLAVLHGIPFAHEAQCTPAMAAKQWFTPFGTHCKVPNKIESLKRRENLHNMFASLEAERKLQAIDIFDVFCPNDQCTYNAKDGEFLYRDEFSHPSVEAARLSSPIIRKVLTSS